MSPSFPSVAPGFSTPADGAACRELIRNGSRSFHMASRLLPDRVRQATYALYGFCRLSDDAVDVEGGGLETVARLRRRLDRIYAGEPGSNPVDRAVADAAATFAIPRAPLDALLEGLAWDVSGRRYETLSDVRAYAARVAGSVGAMMAALMGARTPLQVARACDLGVAMQLTNIARDVGEDARAGRLYLPRAWLVDSGLDPDAWLARPVFGPQIASVTARLLDEADRLYRRADTGIARLPAEFRPAIYASRLIYAEIGVTLARRGLDSISRRTSVGAGRKLALVGRALARPPRASVADGEAPPLPETQFLVDALHLDATRAAAVPTTPLATHDLSWVLDLFDTLERRRRARRVVGSAPQALGTMAPGGRG